MERNRIHVNTVEVDGYIVSFDIVNLVEKKSKMIKGEIFKTRSEEVMPVGTFYKDGKEVSRMFYTKGTYDDFSKIANLHKDEFAINEARDFINMSLREPDSPFRSVEKENKKKRK